MLGSPHLRSDFCDGFCLVTLGNRAGCRLHVSFPEEAQSDLSGVHVTEPASEKPHARTDLVSGYYCICGIVRGPDNPKCPPDFPEPLSLHRFLVSSISSHDQRPGFNAGGSGWSAPFSRFLPFPPVAVSAHLVATSQRWSALQTKGFRYNRPPPSFR